MTVPTFVGRSRRARLALLTLSTVLCSGLAAPAFAESAHAAFDANGVDLVDGSFNLRLPVASIGSGPAMLPLIVRSSSGDDTWSNIHIYRSVSGGVNTIAVTLGDGYDIFTSADGYAASKRGTGATLTVNSNEWMTYQTLDGMRIEFRNPAPNDTGGTTNFCDSYVTANCTLLPDTIDGRSGMTVSYGWTVEPSCTGPFEVDGPMNCNEYWRLGSISNDGGYRIDWTYVNPTGSPVAAWFRRATAVLSNSNVTGSATPTVTYGYPATNVITMTTPGGRTWRVTGSPTQVTGVRRPSASSDTTTIGYSGTTVSAVTRDGVTTNYSRSVSGSTATTTVTDALSHSTSVVADLTRQRITSITDALSHTTSFGYDTVGRPTGVTWPEGNQVQYAYDGRGNLTTTTQIAKAGSGLSNLVSSAAFPATCTDAACNEPTTTTDAAGRVTDYAYDGTTGLVTSVTLPAPTTGATRPQTRYTYATSGVAVLTGTSTCQTGAAPACLGTADEVATSIGYDANLQPVSVTTKAGNNSLSATVATTYDSVGNVTSVDAPLAGADDTTTYRYGADREQLGVIGPDPDGAGPRVRVATRATYNSDGQPSLVETGTVNGTSNSDWAAFASAQAVATSYDANARPVRQDITAGGTTYGVTQASYDSLGRPDCTAVRMNPGVFGSLPGACTASTAGSAGPDRITRVTQYDAVNRATEVTSAYGTTAAVVEKTSLTANGLQASVTDGENNRTSYSYDGFDRLSRTYYSSTTQGAATSSTTDYEELGYDAASNVTSRRLRDGSTVALTVDALNRMTASATTPATGVTAAPPVTYVYDLLGHPTSITDANGWSTGYAYDALGRATIAASNIGTNFLTYDLAGRTTKQQWADGFYVTYDYDVTGNPTAIKEYGSGPLATFGYDSLGRRTSTTLGNGTSTAYAYDPVGRLNTLSHDLAGTSADLSIGLTYNPAGQIATRTSSNDSYAWAGNANGSSGYTADGLNRYSVAGTASSTYDARGNMTSAGGQTYVYNSRNDLYTTGSGGTWYRGPVGLLSQEPGVGNLDWLGSRLVTESNSSVDRRYVYAPGEDTPLVWYEGSGTTNKRWLHADERGSVIAVSDSTGAALAINRYDEYGQPASGNLGRFGYTGQQWIAGLGLWDYKARMYSPALGRFMQTDPIGYGDGLNWYAYVGGDPVNLVDPLGLHCEGGSASESSGRVACAAGGGTYTEVTVTANWGGGSAGANIWSRGGTASFGAGPENGGGGLSPGSGSPQRDPQCTRVVPLPKMMTDATNSALSAINQNPGGNSARDLNSGFSSLGLLPDFSGGGWVSRPSSHSSQAYEHSLPGSSGMSVKVYINDRENSGLNTVTITPPTYSVLHFAEFPFYEAGAPVNTYNAAKYLGGLHGC